MLDFIKKWHGWAMCAKTIKGNQEEESEDEERPQNALHSGGEEPVGDHYVLCH